MMTLDEFIVWAIKTLPKEDVLACARQSIIQYRIQRYIAMRQQETNNEY